ncbi:hypothetical protein Leryth_016277 [Lithospermum erythrorhizon]|nr:hypothetical protein Leryth_016277 [Lithospermum erythrorhizon]
MRAAGFKTTTVNGGGGQFSASRRSWRELIAHPSSYSPPFSLTDFTSRLTRNLNYFRMNYSIIVLFIVFISLLWHPVSIIVFLVILGVWVYVYFGRDGSLVVMNRVVDDRVVLGVMSVVMVVGLGLSGVWGNVFAAGLVGGGVVLVHAAFRVTEDFYVEIDSDDGGGGGGGLSSFVGGSSNVV